MCITQAHLQSQQAWISWIPSHNLNGEDYTQLGIVVVSSIFISLISESVQTQILLTCNAKIQNLLLVYTTETSGIDKQLMLYSAER